MNQENLYLKRCLLVFVNLFLINNIYSQEKITSLNFLQVGAVPKTINERGKNISTSGLTFNYVRFTEEKFYRMDATWLMRYIFNGQKDSANFNDTSKVFGLDLPVFTATYGINIVQGDDFSLGLGINLDSRTFFSSPSAKAKNIIDAVNTGIAIGVKIKLKPWLTYYSISGYDLMFTDAVGSFANGNQFYIQNNFSFLLKGKFGINLQPDFTFKSFDVNGIQGGQIFNKNIKVGLVYAIQ
ncbi:MAG: hypothetical protein Q8K70_02070 [Bacteroidota bacterium]|nr:hypothetical protein [Bacteroidota bacterium]